MQTKFIEDFQGNKIYPGDTIVYAAMSGRSCQLTEGVLLGLLIKESPYSERKVLTARVQPTGRNSRWRQHYSNYDWKNKTQGELPKPVTLQITENMLKVRDGNEVGINA